MSSDAFQFGAGGPRSLAGSPPKLPPLVERTIRRLIRAFAPERIVLFGSYAKGTNHGASDVDLLLITRFEGDPIANQRRARQLAADCFPPVDVVFATVEDVAQAEMDVSLFLLSILASGVTLYSKVDDSASAGE